VSLGLLSAEARTLILAGAIISIALNPLVFRAIEPVQRWVRKQSERARLVERSDDPLAQLPVEVSPADMTNHIVLVGYGRVGKRIGEALTVNGITFVVVEQNRELVERLRLAGALAVSGDAGDPAVLIQGHVARAKALVIATPDTPRARSMLDTARRLNPTIETVVRTHTDADAKLLRDEGIDGVFIGENELARGMIRYTLRRLGIDPDTRAPAVDRQDRAPDPRAHHGG
jgi:Kef-type K+ transport systems, predicted NAD-binding component